MHYYRYQEDIKKQYGDKFIAMHNAKVVAWSVNEVELMGWGRRWPNVPILIRHATKERRDQVHLFIEGIPGSASMFVIPIRVTTSDMKKQQWIPVQIDTGATSTAFPRSWYKHMDSDFFKVSDQGPIYPLNEGQMIGAYSALSIVIGSQMLHGACYLLQSGDEHLQFPLLGLDFLRQCEMEIKHQGPDSSLRIDPMDQYSTLVPPEHNQLSSMDLVAVLRMRPDIDVGTWMDTVRWPITENTAVTAAQLRQVEVLRRVVYNPKSRPADVYSVCASIAALGDLDLLQIAMGKGFLWDSDTAANAAYGGHEHVLLWAQQQTWFQQCPWDAATCAYAAAGGQLDILRLLRFDKKCPWDERTCSYAAAGGHTDVLKWARAFECPWDKATTEAAAQGGHLLILIWAVENGCPHDSLCQYAALGGQLEVLQWARATLNCPWDETVCAAAAEGGHLKLLQWLRQNHCAWDASTCVNAASGGHTEVLFWALEHDCPWDDEVSIAAARSGHLSLLQEIYLKGCPREPILEAAADYGDEELINWLISAYFPEDVTSADEPSSSACSSSVDIVKHYAADQLLDPQGSTKAKGKKRQRTIDSASCIPSHAETLQHGHRHSKQQDNPAHKKHKNGYVLITTGTADEAGDVKGKGKQKIIEMRPESNCDDEMKQEEEEEEEGQKE